MRYSIVGLIAVLLVTSLWTGVAGAQAPGGPGPGAPGPGGAGLRQRLGLTEAQAQRVEAVLAAHRTRMSRLNIAMGRARLDSRELALEAKPDRARIEAVSRRIGDLYGQMARARMEVSFELRGIMTPEQWSRFQELTAQRLRARRDRAR